MKITFEKNVLESVINDAMCAVSEKNTIPAIEGIYFNAMEDGKCVMTSFDTEKGFQSTVECTVERKGRYVINASKLSRIVKLMPDSSITINVNENKLATITGGRAKFELHALSGDDFPSIPMLSGEKGFKIDGPTLKKLISQVFFAIAVSDQRPMLCGAFFDIVNGSIRVVSCDGNRLALREKKCELGSFNREDDEERMSFIVPGKALSQIMKLVSDKDDEVTIYLTRKHVIFKFENKTFFSRLIDSQYIDYERVIPKTAKTIVRTERTAIISALERASLVTEDRALGQAKSCVKCEFVDDVIKVSSSSVTGSVYDEVIIDKEGDDLLIGFNCRYLIDAFRSADSDRVKITLNNPLMSIIIEPEADTDEGERYLYMVSPVKMN
ncbi:MAG: DNA polymerase III subunit beta [Clostridia bacterium]|nr:DNA polymerase III subunit beta [Clostridia bacterium]